ncbi:hypothetical protein LBMAG52_28450 [Planctomycetia bacterium]|nr:hypothetical protein LBMAG52_28450 [Planctomycetia bacterium]
MVIAVCNDEFRLTDFIRQWFTGFATARVEGLGFGRGAISTNAGVDLFAAVLG